MSGVEAWLASQTARRFFDDFAKLAHAIHQLTIQRKDAPETAYYGRRRFVHPPVPQSAFLGQWQEYDLYYVPLPNGLDTYRVRYGNDPSDFRSTAMASPVPDHSGGWIMALKVAQFIAKELELQQPRTRKAILTGE